jgi:hypothetical protein
MKNMYDFLHDVKSVLSSFSGGIQAIAAAYFLVSLAIELFLLFCLGLYMITPEP